MLYDLFKDNGFYININEYRNNEIKEILSKFSGEALEYKDINDYLKYLNDKNLPELKTFKTTTNDFTSIVSKKIMSEENLQIILKEISNLIKKKETYGIER